MEPPYLGTDGGYHPLPLYGDGSPIDVKHLEQAADIVHDTHVLVKWKQGDVLVLDVSKFGTQFTKHRVLIAQNHAVQHARRPWTGARRVLASLWDGQSFPDED